MITHGSPCQNYSISGKQKGGDEGSGTKSSLMWHTVDAIGKTNPKYVVWENVDNVLTDRHKHNFNKYLDRLKELGYNNYSKVNNAKYWGVPQNRKRIFVISIRNDIDDGFNFPISSLQSNGQTSLFNNDMINIEPKVLKDVLQDEVDEGYYLDIEVDLNKDDNILTAAFRGRYNKDSEIDQNLEVKDEQTTNALTNVQKDNVLLEINKVFDIPKEVLNDNERQRRVYNKNGISPSVLARTDQSKLLELNQIGGVNDGEFSTEGTYGQGQRVYADNGLASTIRGEGGGQGGKTGLYLTNYRIRKLTPLECFRLMGFKDKDYWKARTKLETTYYNGRDRSDSQMYRMSGNSIVVNVLEYIFKELLF